MSADDQNPYAPPRPVFDTPARGRPGQRNTAEDASHAWFENGHVWLPRHGGEMPYRCVVCNRPTEFKQVKQMHWHPPAVYLLMCLGWLPYLIAAAMTRKAATVFIPLCAEHEARRKNGVVLLWVGVVAGLGLVFVGSFTQAPALAVFAAIGMLIAAVVGSIQSRVLKISRIDATHVHFTAGIEFMESLPTSPDEEPPPPPRKKKKKKPTKKAKPTEPAEDLEAEEKSESTSEDTESPAEDPESPNSDK